MNLHAVVGPIISAVNQSTPVTVRISVGTVTNPDGSRTPAYDSPCEILAQIQALTTRDLRQMEGLNLQGEMRSIYVMGTLNGVVRVLLKGGDLVTFPDGTVWLVTLVPEPWSTTANWTKAVITLQDGA
jgi:hypothetical protein